jgi:D-arabinose 1-dehydrogenase-like Zn-dependent alcohol dehydrogenase
VYNALTKLGPVRDDEWLAIMGAGGLGLNAIAIATALGHQRISIGKFTIQYGTEN